MRLVFLYGPPAVGKLTVGLALAELTGFKVFHNHLTVNPIVAIFERHSAPYHRLLRQFRVRMLEEAAEARIDLIATWANPRGGEDAARAYFGAVESRGGRVHLVQLVCDRATLLARVGDESRRAMEKLTDAARLDELLDARFDPGPLSFGESLVVDTTDLPPREAALRIAEHYDLPRIVS
jgi:shikimate kinase